MATPGEKPSRCRRLAGRGGLLEVALSDPHLLGGAPIRSNMELEPCRKSNRAHALSLKIDEKNQGTLAMALHPP